MNQARYIAAESIISGGRNEAYADGASANAVTANATFATVDDVAGTDNRGFIENDLPWALSSRGTRSVILSHAARLDAF
jgi:hypothetical protein